MRAHRRSPSDVVRWQRNRHGQAEHRQSTSGWCTHGWPRSGPRTRKVVIDTMLSGIRRKLRSDVSYVSRLRVTRYSCADRILREREVESGWAFQGEKGAPHIVAAGCHHHVEIKTDVNAQGLSYGARYIRYIGLASTNAEVKCVFFGNMTFSHPPRTYTKDVITVAGNLAPR